jgi:ectoine hydroxylase-related dioxygenase (phytanoyl-CoA dioxygenase family)
VELSEGWILKMLKAELRTDEFERDGFAIVHDFCDVEFRDELARTFQSSRPERNVLSYPSVRRLVRSRAVSELLSNILAPKAFAVRAIYFEKSPDANWKVAWHQDLSIAVKEKHEVIGFGPWSEKEGVTHVQPPAEFMAKMVALRLHLDDNTSENGPLKVIPGSHLHGRLSTSATEQWKTHAAVECLSPAGSVLLMRPLLLHSSSASKKPLNRRVLHIEFANFDLPAPLVWHEQIPVGA